MGSSSNQLVALACGVAIVILIAIEFFQAEQRAESVVIYTIVIGLAVFAIREWRQPPPPS